MKTLYTIALLSIAGIISGCADDPNQLLDHGSGNSTSTDPESTAAGTANTFDHFKDSTGGENGITDTHQRQIDELAIGTPQDVAHLHNAQKISYASLGKMLTDLGTSTAGGKAGSLTAGTLYSGGKGALGAPIYSSRTPEMSTPSTSALAKQMDIFVAAAPDIINNIGTSSKRCPGVTLVTAGKFTADGIACLTGKPASDEYVNLANQMVTDVGDPTTGAQIAVATILAAAHISE